MAGTSAGGKAGAIRLREKYGPDFYKNIGSKGGKKGKGHQFAHGKVDPSVAGALGGRRKKTNDD